MTADVSEDFVGADVMAAIRRLAPQIEVRRDETEQLRHIPAALADALSAAGLYRLYLPRSMGGCELPPLLVFEAIEALSKACGSVGWCLMNANAVSLGAGWLRDDIGRRIVGEPGSFRAAGSLRPQGRAEAVAGGYRVSGQWNFASGLLNANWLHCPCQVMEGDKPRLTPAGTPVMRTMWVPAAAVDVIDTWSVMGMRGTGSHDFRIEDRFVPEDYSHTLIEPSRESGPLYRPRFFLTLAHVLFAANALGIARSAFDMLTGLAPHRATSILTAPLRDLPLVQSGLGRADAIISAARCYVIEALTQLWGTVCADAPDPAEDIARLRLAIPHAIHESVRAVDLIFHAAGGNGTDVAPALERQFRDIHVAVQHYAAFPVHFESAGKVLLGLRPAEPGW